MCELDGPPLMDLACDTYKQTEEVSFLHYAGR